MAQRAGVSVEEATGLLARALEAKPEEKTRGDELRTIRLLRDMYAKTL
jgi:hypothetical protein